MTIDRVYRPAHQQQAHSVQQPLPLIPSHAVQNNHHGLHHHHPHHHQHQQQQYHSSQDYDRHHIHSSYTDATTSVPQPPPTLNQTNLTQNAPQQSHRVIQGYQVEHHHNATVKHRGNIQATTRHIPSRLPPPPPTTQTLVQQSSANEANNSTSLIQPNNIRLPLCGESMSAANVARNSMPTINNRIDCINNELPARISLQHNYNLNTHHQQVYPTSDVRTQLVEVNQLTGHHDIVQSLDETDSHPTNFDFRLSNVQSNAYQATSATVVDSSNLIENNTQDYFTEEVIQAILAAKDALEKPIEEREERDITLIDNLCSLVHGFDMFPKRIRRALAAQAVLIVIDEKGKELIVNDEELDSFCVLIFGECEQLDADKTTPIRQYSVGDAFGVLEPTTEVIRFNGHLVTKCENCAFLCVKRHDYYTILTDPANESTKELLRHRDCHGNLICISKYDPSKKLATSHGTYRMQLVKPFKFVIPDGHTIVKATETCLMKVLVHGYDSIDPDYVEDFLLLFRVFMTYELRDKEKRLPPGMSNLCLTLVKWLEDFDYRDKVVKIVLTWLSSYYHDFELNSEFSYLFFRVLESRLSNLAMSNQLHLLRVTLSTKSKLRHVTISRSSREKPLMFSIAGGYEKSCGIFVTHVHGTNFDASPMDNMMTYLNNQQVNSSHGGSMVQPRGRPLNNGTAANHLDQSTTRFPTQLKPGDQILEVNRQNYTSISLAEAQKTLEESTHLSLKVKYNPYEYHEMRSLPEGRRKSSLSSLASASPFPTNGQRFFAHPLDTNHQLASRICNNDPPQSPLFSANVNFGFRSIIKTAPKSDSVLSNLISSSKQFVKQKWDSTVNQATNVETASKTSDNISDDQSNDIDMGRVKSNPDLARLKGKDKKIESGLSNVVRLDDLNPTSITENQSAQGGAIQVSVNVLRVFNAANNDSRYLMVHEATTAKQVVMLSVQEFNLTSSAAAQPSPGERPVSSLDWDLYEVSVVARTIKQSRLHEDTSRLADKASYCSRFYIKHKTQGSLDESLVNEILKESPANVTLTSLNATLLAVELTLADFDKFKSIEPQQFVYDSFFNCLDRSQHSKGQIFNPAGSLSSQETVSLKSTSSDGQDAGQDLLRSLNKTRMVPSEWMHEYRQFADISNREMFWVICEILNERNIGRRVKIVKQFVRVADVCSQLRNYNSMFAIISGLGHSCITRLRRTFEKLKPKYKNQLEKMRSLFDPSRNMSNYRICLSQTQPPAIPLFPQIKKDLTFTKEGRSIFIRESNDPSDDEENNFDEHGGMAGFSQDTIRRKSRPGADLLSVHSAATMDARPSALAQTRSLSYNSFPNNNNNNDAARQVTSDTDSILVNFAEIRQFTERVRNVIYFSSVPYSNDLLTNTKDNQKTSAQIKKMHEEWLMRRRIRHYLNQTLDSSKTKQQASHGCSTSASVDNLDQVDGGSLKLEHGTQTGPLRQQNGRLNISYDERTLYKRSLEIEPELNPRPQVAISGDSRQPQRQHMVTQQQLIQQQALQQRNQQQNQTSNPIISTSSSSSSLQPHAPLPIMLNLQPPPTILPSVANSSPTLSKSSSLSSCSSFSHNHMQHLNHHLPNYASRGSVNLTSSLGKFGTESTESLRKLKALSENVDNQWHSSCNNNNGSNSNHGNGLNRLSGSSPNNEKGLASTLIPKSLVSSRIFPSKGGR